MSHRCHAAGCEAPVPPSMFMCKRHWFSLPKPIRDAIWATYKTGQEVSKTPSKEYIKNARTAIDYIAALEADRPKIENGVTIPCITVWQPWASLIAIGAKPWEFRSWAAHKAYQGRRIAIQAGARKPSRDEVRELILELQSSWWRGTGLVRDQALDFLLCAQPNLAALPRSVIVCTARLGQPIRNADMEQAMGLAIINDSDRIEHTNWGWPLTEIRPIDPPIPCRGSQGFFNVTVPGDHA